MDFVVKKCCYLGYGCVAEQLDAIVEGFSTIIKEDWVSVFTAEELEFAICG